MKLAFEFPDAVKRGAQIFVAQMFCAQNFAKIREALPLLGSVFGRTDFPRISAFGPPDFFAVFFLRDFFSSFFKVARLQSEFCTKDFFSSCEFLVRKMLRNFPRNVRAFVLWVRKKSRKIPSKFPSKFSKLPCEKSKEKFTDELLQERRENIFVGKKCPENPRQNPPKFTQQNSEKN